jgi:uncharacterized phage protein (TIGR01671 family)
MRNIKFRVWDLKLKQWISSDYYIDIQTGKLNYPIGEVMTEYDNEHILMQYTGLKDNKGIEIYEGDITKSHDGYIRKVIWRDNSWKYFWRVQKVFQGELYLEDMCDPIGNTSDIRLGDMIIGNIYENSEVLKV